MLSKGSYEPKWRGTVELGRRRRPTRQNLVFRSDNVQLQKTVVDCEASINGSQGFCADRQAYCLALVIEDLEPGDKCLANLALVVIKNSVACGQARILDAASRAFGYGVCGHVDSDW